MRNGLVRLVMGFVLICGFLPASGPEESSRGKVLARIFFEGIQQWHYSGVSIDDAYSQKSFTRYLNILDPNKQFFTSGDIETFEPYRLRMDDQLSRGDFEFMRMVTGQLRRRIQIVRGFLPEIGEKPFQFSLEESVELEGKKREWARSMKELRQYWRLLLKYQTMIRFLNRPEEEDKEQSHQQLMEKARKDALKAYSNMLDRLMKADSEDYFSRYVNAMLSVSDPHTSYFPPKEQKDFEIEMTGKLEGIGALLTEEDGYVKVVSLVPGGPSWRQKRLEPGDRILKVGQNQTGDMVDIVGMRVDDSVKLIRGPKGTVVRLTVRKGDGRIEEIPIVRAVVVIEETFARSTVIRRDPSGKDFGYIYLPRFYNDFQSEKGRNSAGDIRRTLEELKKRKVSGILLDLRGNTGGTLTDAVRIAGLFISEGPIVQVRDRIRGIQVLKDPDHDLVYSGPLVVLIDETSASASEIVAAALQDYGRAVVAGGDHTFGKGTVQQMLELDRVVRKRTEGNLPPLGALKLTIQKFYRINGKSNQFKGVMSDVPIPTPFAHLEIGERYLPFALNGDSIKPRKYSHWSKAPLPLKRLRLLSRARIIVDPFFKDLREYIRLAGIGRETTRQTLKLDEAIRLRERLKMQVKTLREWRERASGLVFLDGPQGKPSEGERLSRENRERRREWLDQLGKDHILKEGVNILIDLSLNSF